MSVEDTYDYIVIGGGSAGCVVAARLAEERIGSVLLLESGQAGLDNPEVLSADGFTLAFANDRTMWDRMSAPQGNAGNRSVYVGSGTGLGGSGSVNGMVYTRGDKRDFEQWPTGWKWDDVCPYFEALEERLDVRHRSGTSFTEAAIEASLQTGFQRKNGLNDGDLCGFMGYNDMNFRGDQRRSSYTSLIFGREQELDLLTIKTETRGRKILFDDNRKAVAVEYAQQDKVLTARVSGEVIVCAGALETPKLLMLSGVGPADELQKFSIPVVLEAPAIGKNLHDHPSVAIMFRGDKPVDFGYPQLYGFHRVNPALELPENQADVCIVFVSVGKIILHTMLRMAPMMALPKSLYKFIGARNIIRSLVKLVFKIPALQKFTSEMFSIVAILGKPVSRGELRLRSTDPNDTAWIDPAYYKDPADMDTMLAAVDKACAIADAAPLKQGWSGKLLTKEAGSKDRDTVKKWIEKASMTVFHYCGTCSMGETEQQPVDVQLKVKGLDNVRVADASAISEVPVSALNAPSMMIGWRAAQFIIDSRQTPTD